MDANQMKFTWQLKFDSLFEFTSPEYDDRHISYMLTEAQWRVFIRRYNPLADKYQKGFESDEQRRRELEQLIKSARVLNGGQTENIFVYGVYAYSNIISLSGVNPNITTSCFEVGMKINVSGDYVEVYQDGYAIITEITSSSTMTVDRVTQIRVGMGDVAPFDGELEIRSCLGRNPSQSGAHPNGGFFNLPIDFLYAIEESVKLQGVNKPAWVKPVRYDEYLPNINNPYKKPYKNLVWRMDIARQTQPSGDVTDMVESYVKASRKRTELITDDTSTIEYYDVRYLSMPPAIVCNEFSPGDQRHCILDESLHREIVDEAVVIAQAAAQKDGYQIGMSEKQRSQ